MPPYLVRCSTRGCAEAAVYKIAARWSDGLTEELKTYSLCCAACVAVAFRQSREKQAAYRLVAGETLEPPGVYRLERGRRDSQLVRQVDVEARL